MPIEAAEILQLIISGPQKRIHDAAKVWSTTQLKNNRATSTSDERLNVLLEVSILLLNLTEVTELDNYRASASRVIERLYPEHPRTSVFQCQGSCQDAYGLVE